MANPFFNPSPSSSAPNNDLHNLYKMLSTAKNPYDIFNNIAKNNPNMAPIVNLLNNGYNPQQVFHMMCQQRGINPQEFINRITNGNNIFQS